MLDKNFTVRLKAAVDRHTAYLSHLQKISTYDAKEILIETYGAIRSF